MGILLHSLSGKGDEISQSSKSIIFYSLAAFEEDERWIATKLDLFTKLAFCLTIDFSDVKFSLHFTSQLFPCLRHMLTMRTPWGIEFNKPSCTIFFRRDQ